jgi:hypothetical protein
MIHNQPNALTVAPDRQMANALRTVAMVQGGYFVLTGLWPILSIDSFQAVTGPKTDLWLVYTVGALVTAIGSSLLLAAANRRLSTEIAYLGIGSALALGAIDVIFVLRGVISWVYLLDAAAEIGLIIWWAALLSRSPPPAPAGRYPHVEALLARGQSVSPNGPS